MATLPTNTLPTRLPGRRFDIGPGLKGVMIAGAGGLMLASVAALARLALGIAPDPAGAKEVAVIVHLTAVLPAIPLGLYVMLTRKGTARHRMLGKLWMAMMIVTALSAIFIRHLNHGHFSVIHLFVPLVLVTAWRAVAAARKGDIAKHRRTLVGMFLGAMIVPGLFALLPGRIMGMWLFG